MNGGRGDSFQFAVHGSRFTSLTGKPERQTNSERITASRELETVTRELDTVNCDL
jgi:hypothetical protein